MAPGIAYLDAPGDTRTDAPSTPSSRRRRSSTTKKPKTQKAAKSSAKKAQGPTEVQAAGKEGGKRRPRAGPKAALTTLIDDGYFKTHRTISDVQNHLRHKKGLSFKVTDLSPAFVRLLREGTLDRDKNESGQYEYKAP
jgi:hypothetical protein